MKRFGLQFLLLAAFVFAAFAQVTTGRLEGTVTDPQGAAVPGATVKIALIASAPENQMPVNSALPNNERCSAACTAPFSNARS